MPNTTLDIAVVAVTAFFVALIYFAGYVHGGQSNGK